MLALSSIPDLDSSWMSALSPFLFFPLVRPLPADTHGHCHRDATFTRESHFISSNTEFDFNQNTIYSPQVFRNFKHKVNFHIQWTITIS